MKQAFVYPCKITVWFLLDVYGHVIMFIYNEQTKNMPFIQTGMVGNGCIFRIGARCDYALSKCNVYMHQIRPNSV